MSPIVGDRGIGLALDRIIRQPTEEQVANVSASEQFEKLPPQIPTVKRNWVQIARNQPLPQTQPIQSSRNWVALARQQEALPSPAIEPQEQPEPGSPEWATSEPEFKLPVGFQNPPDWIEAIGRFLTPGGIVNPRSLKEVATVIGTSAFMSLPGAVPLLASLGIKGTALAVAEVIDIISNPLAWKTGLSRLAGKIGKGGELIPKGKIAETDATKVSDQFFAMGQKQGQSSPSFIPIKGKPVTIPGYEGYDFLIHRPLSPEGQSITGWVITEGKTGLKVIERFADTQKEAINQAITNLNKAGGKTKLDSLISGVKEISPRYRLSEPITPKLEAKPAEPIPAKPVEKAPTPTTEGVVKPKEAWQMTRAEALKGRPVQEPSFVTNLVEFEGLGKPGLSSESRIMGIGEHQLKGKRVVYRDTKGKPIVVAQLIDTGKGLEVENLLAVKESGLLRGRALKAVWEEVERLGGAKPGTPMSEEAASLFHRVQVRQALAEGKPVPSEVLKDYPELVKQVKPAVTPEVTTIEKAWDEASIAGREALAKKAGIVPDEVWGYEKIEGDFFSDLPLDVQQKLKVAIPKAEAGIPKAEAGGIKPPGKVPPNSPLGKINTMWGKGREPTPRNVPDKYLKVQEQINDIYYGIRRMQSQVGKKLPIEAGGKLDITTYITRAPGAANAGATRYVLAIQAIKKIAPDISADSINTIIYANHAKEVLAQKGAKRVMAGGFKTGQELDDALNMLRTQLGDVQFNKAQQAAEVVKRIYGEELNRLVSAGKISESVAKELRDVYPWYNPLRYVERAEEMALKGKSIKPFNAVISDLQRLTTTGTAKEAVAPLEVLADQLIRNEVSIVKNETVSAIIKVGLENPGLGIQKVSNKYVFKPGYLSFFENGERLTYKVPDFIYREAEVLSQTISNPVSSIIGALNGISRTAFTTASPPFVVANMLNDSLTAFLSRGITAPQSIARLLGSLRGLQNDKIMQSFRLAGAYQQRFYGRSASALAREVGVTGGQIIKGREGIFSKIAHFIPRAGEAGEQSPRMALFLRQLNKNLPNWRKMTAEAIAATPQAKKAAAEAVELTINFGRGSYLSKAANPYIIFLNANMEAMKLPFRVLRDNPAAGFRLAGVMAGGIGVTAYNLSYPEYFDIPPYIRWGSFVVMLPSKEKDNEGRAKPNYLTIIPRTREWAAFLGSETYAMEKMMADSPEDFGQFSSTLAPMLLPISNFPAPQLLTEVFEQSANWDFYRSQPIVSQSLENLPPEEQTKPWTSRTIKEIATKTGISPIRLEHGVSGLFGGAGKTITSITDLVINLLSPERPDEKIVALANRYESLPTAKDKETFMSKLTGSTKNQLRNYLDRPEQMIPVVSPTLERVMPGRGGEFERKQFELEESISFLPSYIRSSEIQIASLDLEMLQKEKVTDSKLRERYSIEMIGKTLRDRERFRRQNPEIDAVMNFWGDVETLQSSQARTLLIQKADKLGIPYDTIPALQPKKKTGGTKAPVVKNRGYINR